MIQRSADMLQKKERKKKKNNNPKLILAEFK